MLRLNVYKLDTPFNAKLSGSKIFFHIPDQFRSGLSLADVAHAISIVETWLSFSSLLKSKPKLGRKLVTRA